MLRLRQFLGILLLCGLPAGAQTNSPSSVLLITVDTLRADRLEPYGYSHIKTPTVLALAGDGILFETAICQAPMTLPSHATILTGTYPNYHGVRDVIGRLRSDIPTLPEVYQNRNYDTAAFVGSSVLSANWGLDRGFDIYDDRIAVRDPGQLDLSRIERPANEVVDRAVDWINARTARPFFLWIHLFDPHDDYRPPEPYRSRYKDRLYDGEVAFVDDQLGRLVELLKTRKLYDDMLIVFTSDHGEALGEHQETYHGFFLYEEVLHVPLIIKMPKGEAKGKRVDALVRTSDIMPTLLQATSLPIPPTVQGESLVGLISGKRSRGPAAAYSETLYPKIHFGWSPLYSWRTATHKYIQAPKPELYDLRTDGEEARNIIDGSQALANRMQSDLRTQQRRFDQQAGLNQSTAPEVDLETMEKLRSLGYVAFSGGTTNTPEEDLPDPKDKIGVYNKLNRAIEVSRTGSRDETIALLEEVAKIEPEMPIVHFLIGQEYFNKAFYLKATECFRETLRLNPASSVAAFQLAQSYYLSGFPEKAEVGLRELIRSDPSHYGAYHLLAKILGKRGEFKSAIEMDLRVVELRPDHSEAHNNLGTYYFQTQDLNLAEKHYLKAAELSPGFALARANLALVYLNRRVWDLAEDAAREAVKADPNMGLGYYYLGQALRGKGRETEAQSAFDRARRLDPGLTPPR